MNSNRKTAGLTLLLLLLLPMVLMARPALTKMEGKPLAPSFELTDINGKIHRLSNYRGKTLVINFWATWCPPCRAEMPAMNTAWKTLQKEGVVMFAINSGESEKRVRKFLKDVPIDFIVLLDEEGDVPATWPIPGLPTTYIVDPQGRFVYRALGGREWDNEAMLDMIRAVNPVKQNKLASDP